MLFSPLRLTCLATGLVAYGFMASPALAAPTVTLGHDNNVGSVDPHPNALAKYNEFVGSLASFGTDDLEDLNPTLSFGATGITATVSGATALFNGGFGLQAAS